MGGSRRTVVTIRRTRSMGCQYVEPESLGMELVNEDMAKLH